MKRFGIPAAFLLIASTFVYFHQITFADNNYFALSNGVPFTQDWPNVGLITVNDNWNGVPSINGYRGDDAAVTTPVADA